LISSASPPLGRITARAGQANFGPDKRQDRSPISIRFLHPEFKGIAGGFEVNNTPEPIVIDATGRDIHAEGARMREQGPIVQVELPGGVRF